MSTPMKKPPTFLPLQADDFLNAYKVLHANNLALIRNLANQHREISKDEVFGMCSAMGADIVCLSFSVELHIKYLHHVISQKIPWGHDLSKLFKNLPPQIQADVCAHPSIAKYGWSTSQFDLELSAISDGFEKWRYSFETNTLSYNTYFALVLIEAIKSVAAAHSIHSKK